MKPLTDKSKLLVVALVLVALMVAVYWPVLHHEFIDYDDPDYVTQNELVKQGVTQAGAKWAFTTGHASNWHPVTWLSHMLDVQWFGLKPAGHHGTNLFFHAANSVLLLLLLFQMTGAVGRSAFVATLFALHPLHVESVAWVAERKDVLSTFFGLLCLMAYTRYVRASASKPIDTSSSPLPGRGGKGERLRSGLWYVGSFLLLALGLMSKPMLVTWPFVMLLLDIWPLKRIELSTFNTHPSTLKKLVLEKLPFLALVVGSCVVTFLVQRGGGAITTMENLPLEDRFGNAIVSYAKYLFMTFWPSGLAIFYPHPEWTYPNSTQWPSEAIGVTFVALFMLSALVVRHRKNTPYLFTGWFWYLGTLVPVIGLVQVGTQALADRYTYVPLIGVFIMLAWGAHILFQRLKIPSLIYPVLGTAVVVLCAILAAKQVQVWQDDFTLFEHALKVTSGNAPAHSTLGKAWAKKGDFEKGLEHLRAAKNAAPLFPNIHNDIGATLFFLGRYAEAADEYLAGLASNPDHLLTRNNLASAYWSMGKHEDAIEQYRLVLRAKPDYLQSLSGLGSALASLGRAEEAVQYLRRASEMDPQSESAKVDLARVLASLGRFEEAEHILSGIPDGENKSETRMMLGNILMESGRTNEAAHIFKETSQRFPKLAEQCMNAGKRQLQSGNTALALNNFVVASRLSPNLAEAHQSTGLVLAQLGRMDTATGYFERAIELAPSGDNYYYLALACTAQSNFLEAIAAYKKAIELQPDSTNALNNLAWMLATHPDATLRDGPEAVALAERACKLSDHKQPVLLGTLAAAYAEAGRFADAIRTGELARELAASAGLTELASRNARLLEQYRLGKPHRETLTAEPQ